MELINSISGDYEITAVSSPGKELDQISESGFKVYPLKMNRRISIISDLISLIRLYLLIRHERPTIVHSITPKAGLLAMMAAKMAHVPIRIHTFTGLVFPTASGLKKRLLMTTDQITCACATNVLSEGQGVRGDLMDAGITSKHVAVLGHGNIRGVDLTYYTKSPRMESEGWRLCHKLGVARDTKIMLFVGRIVEDKGIAELIAAFRLFSHDNPDWKLLLVGTEETPLPTHIKHAITHNPKIAATEEWVDDVRPYYAVAKMLVLPSYREGFPNVVLEAGAMRLPSIVTDINGSSEIIADGYNGLIIPPHDTNALWSAMQRIAYDKQAAQTMGMNARHLVADRYEIGFVTKCASDYYEELLNDNVTSH